MVLAGIYASVDADGRAKKTKHIVGEGLVCIADRQKIAENPQTVCRKIATRNR